MAKWKYGTIGSVSHATMRAEDLIPAFCEELRYLGHRSVILSEIERESNKRGYYESENPEFDLDELFSMLDSHSLPYFYFGAHVGDGSDYGFWLSESFEEDFDGLKVSDLSEVPAGYSGEMAVINDHGNITLYTFKHGHKRELWAIV
jgi:hypothetical protein